MRLCTTPPRTFLLALMGASVLAAGAPGVAAGASCPGAGLTSDQGAIDQLEAATVCLMNKERGKRGRKPLKTQPILEKSALRHTIDMITGLVFSHEGTDGSTVTKRVKKLGYLKGVKQWWVGENVAYGYGSTSSPRGIMDMLMHSPDHKANILSRRFEEVGVGVEIGSPEKRYGDQGATYTQDFGARR